MDAVAGKVYFVPTPVGNFDDMTPRAISVLNGCDIILAEDTRTSGILMKRFDIATPMISYHKFNEHQMLDQIMQRLESGQNIAVVTDAGTPGISDPGFLISRECRRRGVTVETLPGSTAFVPALVDSGLPCERFCFEGFLPQKKGRETRLREIADETRTTIIYESPLRLVKTLESLAAVCGDDREASVSREISKLHESTMRGTLSELTAYYTENIPRGEIVIILSGKPEIAKRVHRNKYKE